MKVPTVPQAFAFYLAPVFGLTSIVLSLFTLLAPTFFLHDQVAFFSIQPSTAPSNSKAVNGPSIFLGPLGSCSRADKSSSIECTPAALSPIYDLSLLPNNAPGLFFMTPGPFASVFMAISISLMILFFITYTCVTFSHRMGKISAVFAKPFYQRLSSWLGIIALMFGVGAFTYLRIWMGKAIDDFNLAIMLQGSQGPDFSGSNGNAIIMYMLAYIFFFVPVVCSMIRVNVKASTGKWAV